MKIRLFFRIYFGGNYINSLAIMKQLYSNILNNKVAIRGIHNLLLIFNESFQHFYVLVTGGFGN